MKKLSWLFTLLTLQKSLALDVTEESLKVSYTVKESLISVCFTEDFLLNLY